MYSSLSMSDELNCGLTDAEEVASVLQARPCSAPSSGLISTLAWTMSCFSYSKGGLLARRVGAETCRLLSFITGDAHAEGVRESSRGEKDTPLMRSSDAGPGWASSPSWILMSSSSEFSMAEGRDGSSDSLFGLIGGVSDFGSRGLSALAAESRERMTLCGRQARTAF